MNEATATQDDWQRQCAIVMSGKIRYDTLVLELFRVVISQLYAQLILKTNLSQQSYSYLSQNNLKWKYIHWNSILQKWLIIYWNELTLLQNNCTFFEVCLFQYAFCLSCNIGTFLNHKEYFNTFNVCKWVLSWNK